MTLLTAASLDEAISILQQQLQNTSAVLSPSSILSPNDIRRALSLREEFPREQINAKLKALK
jgi:hypothetical protein